MSGPLRLLANNFTESSRTPWAGFRIGKDIKSNLLPLGHSGKIGESWEFSLGPELPSVIASSGRPLVELMETEPALFSESLARPELLLKILEAEYELSVQVHPDDQNPDLKPDECGKPESWLVLDAAPGAGIYLGFAQPLSLTRLESLLRSGESIADLLNFVPVKPFDYFEIEPGTVHSLGKHVLLAEPQRVRQGKSGKTYRMWDWGRTYNEGGGLQEDGKPRELHLDESLRLVDPLHQVGERFVEKLRRVPLEESQGATTVRKYPANNFCQLTHVASTSSGSLTIDKDSGYTIITVLVGGLTISTNGKDEHFAKGETFVLPANSFPVSIVWDSDLQFLVSTDLACGSEPCIKP